MPTRAPGPIVPAQMASERSLSHLDSGNRPQMVDVGGKPVTRRTAHAVAIVALPPALARLLEDGEIAAPKEVEIHCRARTEARTGVEMEALTGASVAALTLYDMGKAVSHGIVIREIRLLEKTGGKRDYSAP